MSDIDDLWKKVDAYVEACAGEPSVGASSVRASNLRESIAHALKNAHDAPIPMLLWCPSCHVRHVDVVLAVTPHHTHACQNCGLVWRPALVPTVGVAFLPGFRDPPAEGP